ncbi:hypothetical protein ACIQ7D_34635 [Streptomyces sp. NPDC096310]|uniref:hypothetical protein n=1 Tax=Streptomyces sp. NPDC096310 TaxID=3366082 RepID=UPI0037F3E366
MTSTERPEQNTADSADRPHGIGRRSPFAVAAVAAAVLIAGGGGAYFATSAFGSSGGGSGGSGDSKAGGGADDGNPPPLALDAPAAEPGAGAADSPPPGVAPGEPDPRGVVYRATGKLPAGPDTARVYRTSGTVPAADVARLAKAFGMNGAPRSDGTSWKVGTDKDGSGPLLRVAKQAPGAWTFARFGAAPGGDNCLKGRSCPSGGGTGPGASGGSFAPGSEDGAVGEAAAKKAAAPVLKALRQDDADIDASRLMGAVRVVNADPVIGGLPTYGWSTAVQVDPDGRVTGGYGQLTPPERSDAYPVISAAEALKELNRAADGAGSGTGSGAGRIGGCATPVPLEENAAATGKDVPPALPCAPKSGAAATDPVKSPESVEITRTVFGLAVRSVDGRGALVPSWLFEVAPGDGSAPYTVTHPAVAPKFLKKAAPKPPPAHQELPGGPGAADPGAAPAPRATSYEAAGRTLTVHFTAGVCSTYAATADESGTAVKVRLVVTDPDPERVCIALAKEQSVKVTLDKPLGDRQVVDTTTGEKIARR